MKYGGKKSGGSGLVSELDIDNYLKIEAIID